MPRHFPQLLVVRALGRWQRKLELIAQRGLDSLRKLALLAQQGLDSLRIRSVSVAMPKCVVELFAASGEESVRK
eukprot:5420637-Pyramimonas_sp.AAC.1